MAVRPETNAIIARYDRRTVTYDPLAPWVYMTRQELERAYMRWLRTCAPVAPDQLRLLELGCQLQVLCDVMFDSHIVDDTARRFADRGNRCILGEKGSIRFVQNLSG